MLSDRDMIGLQSDFGTLAGAIACSIWRGTPSSVTKVVGKPFINLTNHTCTVLTPAQITNPFMTSYLQSVTQDTKNARIILMPLPIPNSVSIHRNDYVMIGTQVFSVLDLGDNMTYQFQRILYCQYVEGMKIP